MKAKMVVKVKKKLNLTLPNAASGLLPWILCCRQPKTFAKQQPVLHFDVGFFQRASRNSPFHLGKLKGNSKQATIHK